MNFIKKLLIYFIGNVFNKLIVFFLLPIYTSNLSPSAYGDADLSLTTVTMLVSLLFMEVWTPLLRFSYDSEKRNDKIKVFNNVIIVVCICMPIYFVGCLIIGKWQNLPHLTWMIVYGLSILILHIYQFEVRAVGNSKDFMLSGMISSIAQLVISFIAIYLFKANSEVILLAPAISNIIASIYLEFKYKFISQIKKSYYSFEMVSSIIKYAFPLAINAVAFWAMTNINRYFSRAYLGSAANGYIAVATKFIALINTIVQIYSLAWQESAYEHCNSQQRSNYYSKMLTIYLDVMSVGTCIAIVATNVLFPYIISDVSYEKTQLILPIYYISAFASAISNFYGHIYNALKKTNILLFSTIGGAVVNIALLYITINKFGIYSIPISLIAGYSVNVFMRIVNISEHVKIKLNYTHIIINALSIVMPCLIVYLNCNYIIKLIVFILSLGSLIYCYRKDLGTLLHKIKKGVVRK